MVRRILNTSTRLEWDEYVAPTLSEYMKRMALAGYNENYRKTTLIHAISIFDHMKSLEPDPCIDPGTGKKRKEGHSIHSRGGACKRA